MPGRRPMAAPLHMGNSMTNVYGTARQRKNVVLNSCQMHPKVCLRVSLDSGHEDDAGAAKAAKDGRTMKAAVIQPSGPMANFSVREARTKMPSAPKASEPAWKKPLALRREASLWRVPIMPPQ